jgi:uncharacterized membrane protein
MMSLACGLIVFAGVLSMHARRFAPLAGWDTLAVVYVVSVFIDLRRSDAAATKAHAVRENPGRAATDILLLCGSVASLIGVGLLMTQAASSGVDRALAIGLGLFSVVVSWTLVHTAFVLRYARLYYGKPEGGISFNQDTPPRYSDFAYLAFTLGMTFQVSDTNISSAAIRSTVLRHCLLSYLFGTVIIATTINTIASLMH